MSLDSQNPSSWVVIFKDGFIAYGADAVVPWEKDLQIWASENYKVNWD